MTTRLSKTQKQIIQVLVKNIDEYVITFLEPYQQHNSIKSLLKRGLIERGVELSKYTAFYRLTEVGRKLAIELGFMAEQPNVMDKDAGDVHEETPFVFNCDAQAWQDMVRKSMADDVLVWKIEFALEYPETPRSFASRELGAHLSHERAISDTYYEMTGKAYRPLQEAEYYHFVANHR